MQNNSSVKEKIIVLGASGFIGIHLIRRLLENNSFEVMVLVHKHPLEAKSENLNIIYGDLLDFETLEKLFRPCSTVINLAYLIRGGREVNLEIINNIIKACEKKKVKKLLHVSTSVVCGRATLDKIDETTMCLPFSKYDQIKWQIEQALLNRRCQRNLQLTILRPTHVFGENGSNLLKLINDLTYGSSFKNYLKSCLFGTRKMNLVSVECVVDSILFLMDIPVNNNEVFIISADEDEKNNFQYIEELLMKSLGISNYLLPRWKIPIFVLTLLLRFLGRSNINPNRIYSSQKIINLGFRRTSSLEDEIMKYLDWYKKNISREAVVQ